MRAASALGFLLVLGLAQPASAQNVTTACSATSLCLDNNYFVTGDYVVGGAVYNGKFVNGLEMGTVTIPDPLQPNSTGVPAGADIVAAFLYWETVESTNLGALTGQGGSFNGYPITGMVLGNPKAPTSWSNGGCSGGSNGSKTMHAYRADVRPFLPLDANGNIQTPNAVTPFTYQVALQNSGSMGNNGNGVPFTLGASLVIIYRVLSPAVPLNSIVLYDGAVAPDNSSSTFSQPIVGFYQAAASPIAKITHIVGNGQPNKSEMVMLNSATLPPLYGANNPSFPGIYNGSWDNATWTGSNSPINTALVAGDTQITSVVPTGNNPTNTNGTCVNWGAIIFSTTVQDSDGDGLLDVWEDNQGYIDASSGQWVALPGANKSVKDIFAEVDYLSNLDGLAGTYKHSHLPQRAAVDMVGQAFQNAPVDCDPVTKVCKGINVHFDLGPGIYQGDQYVIAYPVSTPLGVPTFPGAGGNSISEGATIGNVAVIGNVPVFVCTDGVTLCPFPGQAPGQPGPPVVGWKGGYLFVKRAVPNPNGIPSIPLLGNFQPGRGLSYHYVLFGHLLGESRSVWNAAGTALADPTTPRLISIVNTGTSAKVTIQSPPLLLKPGDCLTNPGPAACSDANSTRVAVGGALAQPNLNGTYFFSNPSTDNNNVTTFTITTTRLAADGTTLTVADGTYEFSCAGAATTPPCMGEPQLGVSYLGPVSRSGFSDWRGGADSAETFGGWPADDPLNADGTLNCQRDPSQPLGLFPAYCTNQVGSVLQQAGTLMHELGHTLTLTHGGTYYKDPQNPSVPTYGLNCKANFLSTMSYAFVTRGFPDNQGIGYSSQIFPLLDETKLDESTGIGLDSLGNPAIHLSRWYAPPNALDNQLNTVGGRFAKTHCDGTPIGATELPAVRVDGALAPGGTFSGPLDWNNDLIVPDLTEPVASQDVNFNGRSDAPFEGFNDWQNIDLLQIGARAGAFGFSGVGGNQPGSGGNQPGSGGNQPGSGGNQPGSGGNQPGSGGIEQDQDTFNSTVDPPNGLKAVEPTGAHFVNLNWSKPRSGQQIRIYYIWRADKPNAPIGTLGKATATTPPPTFFQDPNVKNGQTYTYFVTAALGKDSGPNNGNQSGSSNMETITISFNTGATGTP